MLRKYADLKDTSPSLDPRAELSTVLLVVRDVADWQLAVVEMTDAYGYRVLTASSTKKALQMADETRLDLIVSEVDLHGEDGVTLLEQFRTAHPDVTRILVRERDQDKSLLGDAADRAAIYQFLRKPLDSEQIGLVVKRALEARELGRRHRLLSRELKLTEDSPVWAGHLPVPVAPTSRHFEKLVYASEAMAELCELAQKAAKTDLPILVQGETGTGKELLARAVHYQSARRQSPLLAQNCGGLPDELLHSELFGHKRGAFTGAVSNRLGLFRAADGGTVFLDEISELSPSFQVSLLRFLQEGEVKPLGSDETIVCDVRIIAASNRRLEEMVDRREFRRDLFYRIRGFELVVPPLRERRDDIPALTEFFVQKYGSSMGHRVLGVASDVVERLRRYDFRGNVRELETEVRRMVALSADRQYLTMRHLSANIAAATQGPTLSGGGVLMEFGQGPLKSHVERLERRLVGDALTRNRWNQTRAAQELGVSRVGLANKIKRYQLDRQTER